jgi:hypothetical protein
VIILKLNDKQIEGLARILDTLAISAILATVVGLSGHSPLSFLEISCLVITTPILTLFAIYLRR